MTDLEIKNKFDQIELIREQIKNVRTFVMMILIKT